MAAAVVAAGLILHHAATQRDAVEEQAAMVARSAAAIRNDEVATAKALVDGLSASRGLRSLMLFDSDGNPLLHRCVGPCADIHRRRRR